MIGDIPIYVAMDSADAWAHPELFQLDRDNVPTCSSRLSAGRFLRRRTALGKSAVPLGLSPRRPDISGGSQQTGLLLSGFMMSVRIDHFRGFDEYYSIPYG